MNNKPRPRREARSPQSDSHSNVLTQFYHDHRGQTFFDFVVGITLFLLVILFTVFFIPDLIDPFEPSQDASTILADRGADHLTQNVMRAEGEGPYVLDRACTVALFDDRATDACNVDHNELRFIVGMGDRSHAHAQLENREGDIVVIDGVQMEVGDDVERATSGDVYSATRVVTIDGQRYELTYRVW